MPIVVLQARGLIEHITGPLNKIDPSGPQGKEPGNLARQLLNEKTEGVEIDGKLQVAYTDPEVFIEATRDAMNYLQKELTRLDEIQKDKKLKADEALKAELENPTPAYSRGVRQQTPASLAQRELKEAVEKYNTFKKDFNIALEAQAEITKKLSAQVSIDDAQKRAAYELNYMNNQGKYLAGVEDAKKISDKLMESGKLMIPVTSQEQADTNKGKHVYAQITIQKGENGKGGAVLLERRYNDHLSRTAGKDKTSHYDRAIDAMMKAAVAKFGVGHEVRLMDWDERKFEAGRAALYKEAGRQEWLRGNFGTQARAISYYEQKRDQMFKAAAVGLNIEDKQLNLLSEEDKEKYQKIQEKRKEDISKVNVSKEKNVSVAEELDDDDKLDDKKDSLTLGKSS